MPKIYLVKRRVDKNGVSGQLFIILFASATKESFALPLLAINSEVDDDRGITVVHAVTVHAAAVLYVRTATTMQQREGGGGLFVGTCLVSFSLAFIFFLSI